MFSCHTDDKCYCSVSEDKANDSEDVATTTWCDSDSCISQSKCYCKSKNFGAIIPGKGCNSDNLALDYELFTIGSGAADGNGGSVRTNDIVVTRTCRNRSNRHSGDGQHLAANEALSVKKSVEMAALFADVKLSQTTDIKNLKPSKSKSKHKQQQPQHQKQGKEKDSVRSNRSDLVVLKNSNNIRKMLSSNNSNSCNGHHHNDDHYQSIVPRPVSASLEDSLGYLP